MFQELNEFILLFNLILFC